MRATPGYLIGKLALDKRVQTRWRAENGLDPLQQSLGPDLLRAAVLKALVTWLAGAVPALEGGPAREANIVRLLGRAQDWRGALKASPERFLLDPKTLVAGAEMQRETPLAETDLTLIAEGPKDALALAELLIVAKQPRWLMGWRDICRSTDERTVIASVFPRVGTNHKAPLFYLCHSPQLAAAFLASITSLSFDYAARQKIGGTSLTYFYLKLPLKI